MTLKKKKGSKTSLYTLIKMDAKFHTITLPLFLIVKKFSLLIHRCNPAQKMHYLNYSSFVLRLLRVDKITSAIITELQKFS